MSNDVETSEHWSDDDVLRFTQNKRRTLVTKITADGMPTDNKDRLVLLTALSDMDRTALTNKRIGSQEKISKSDQMVALAMAKLTKTLGNQNPFESDEITNRSIDAEYEKIPIRECVEGEMTIGIEFDNYDEFMKKF